MNKDKCIIFTGGEKIHASSFEKSDFENAYIIAADSGCSQIELLNENGFDVSPDVLLGDMDSYKAEEAKKAFPKAEFVRYPSEKDYTDTQLALELSKEKGFSDVEIIGGTGGRVDHLLSNLALLRKGFSDGMCVTICDGKNLIFYLNGGNIEIDKNDTYKYFSLIPDEKSLDGVTITGAKYPLSNSSVDKDFPITLSNEITMDLCSISIQNGSCFVIFSRD